MKALTVCEPFASALIFGGKSIENRSKPIYHVGPLLIHAGKSIEWCLPPCCQWVHERWPGCPANYVTAMDQFKGRMGHVIGLVYVRKSKPLEDPTLTPDERKWATGPECIPCSLAVALKKPFPWRGQQGVFQIPAAALPEEVITAADDMLHIVAEMEARK